MIAIARKSVRRFPRGRQPRFEQLLPAVRRTARSAFRHLSPEERDEAVADVVANAFRAFRRLAELDKLDVAYAGVLARSAIAQYRSGPRVGASLRKRDVLASPDRGRGRRVVGGLDCSGDERDWCETLADDRRWSVSDQAAFRVDFPGWLRSLNRRDRRLVQFLGVGNRACDAAAKFGLTPGRISQLRAEWKSSWDAFHGVSVGGGDRTA